MVIDRRFIGTSTSNAICRDEKESRMILRFNSSTENLDYRAGVMGQRRSAGGKGIDIVNATGDLINKSLTPLYGRPIEPHERPPVESSEEIKGTSTIQFVTRTEVSKTDAASNEMLATGIMKKESIQICGKNSKVW